MLEAYFWSTRVKCADRLISSDINRGPLKGSVQDALLLGGGGGGISHDFLFLATLTEIWRELTDAETIAGSL